MATPITCDSDASHGYADVMVSRIANGEVTAWCDSCFLAMCQAVAETVAQAEADAADAEALARLGDESAQPQFPTQPASSGVADPAAELPSQPDSGPAESEPTASDAPPAEEPTEPTLATRSRGSRTG